MGKATREAALVKPVVKVALEVADEHFEALSQGQQSPYATIDVVTRLRAAICLATEADLSTHALVERELKLKLV